MGSKEAKPIHPPQNSTKKKAGVVQSEIIKEANPEYQKPSQSPTPEPVQTVPEEEDLNPQKSSTQDAEFQKMELTGQTSALIVRDEVIEEERQYLVFVLDNTLYGVDISFVQTTIKPQPIYLVPGTVEFIKGLINLRGSVVPVVDLRTRFGLNQKELDKKTRFIVVEVGNIMASLVVDAVQGVQTIKESLIEQPSTIVMDTNTKFLKGVARFNNQLILMLNLDLTIHSEFTKG
jgi:purine-binding chemotaxis protein CheW